MLPRKKVVTVKEALNLWIEFNKEKGKEPPVPRYLYRYCERYEGLLCYRNSENKWRIYPDVLLHYLEHGFPDLAIRQPVMELAVALRYLHKNGIPPTYKLRELKKDLAPLGMIIKNKDPKIRDRVTRSNLNKFIGIWNGNR